jgi:PSP1 domain protein
MKISDVEFQGDGSKATFYYTAEGRVDFRQLIKDMARAFGIRIEMRQIGFRQEAARLGGIGSCGRELCCATWLTDFRSVSTSAARYQQLSLNPQKLAGQCGKLKCCLNFELDTYLDALKDFPKTETKLHTQRGLATCQKIDIFKRLMWYTYDESPMTWYKLSVDSVKEIIELNKEGQQIEELEEYTIINDLSSKRSSSSMGLEMKPVEEDSITRFDTPRRRKKKNNQAKKAQNRPDRASQSPEGKVSQKAENVQGQGKKQGQNPNAQKQRRGQGQQQAATEGQSQKRKPNNNKNQKRPNNNSEISKDEKN